MSKTFSFNLPFVEVSHVSGTRLSSVAADLDDVFLNASAPELARSFARSLRTSLLKKGEYQAVLRYLPQAQVDIHHLRLCIPCSDKRQDESPHVIELAYVKWTYHDGTILAAFPSLGIGHIARESARLEEQLQEALLLSFKRHQRLDSYHGLIAAQWFEDPHILEHSVKAEFYTPAELEDIAEGQKQRLLPALANRMNRSQQTFFELDTYLQAMADNLEGGFRQSVLIVGPPGSGKTALVQAYEQRVGKKWWQKPWTTSAARVIQALTEHGAWQYGFGQLMNELRDRGEVLYLGKLVDWFEVGQYVGNSVSLADAMRDYLQRNEVLVIAEVTEEQLAKIELRSPGYSDLFHVIRFAERKIDVANRIGEAAVCEIAARYKMSLSHEVITALVSLQRRYAPYSGFPGKTIRFFESLILQKYGHCKSLGLDDALSAFCEESGMPRFLIDPALPLDIDAARDFFSTAVIGQNAALDSVLQAMLTTKAGLAPVGKPIMSLLFVGPTGVGKTQLAKTLAQFIFGDARRMIRLDMSEYSDPYAVSRLIANSSASLVSKVRQQPFGVVLFDEIEKAAGNFFDLLLQILGEGRLTDDRGDIANFCSSIIVMTSNLGAQDYMRPRMGFRSAQGDDDEHFAHVVARHFRPELVNRLDRLVPFTAHSPEERLRILRKEVESVLQTEGIRGRKVQLVIDETVWRWLEMQDIDFRYGARAIQRFLQQHLVWPLAQALSAEPASESLNVTLCLNASENLIKAHCERLTDNRKNISTVFELNEQVATVRRVIQGLREGNPWVALQSEHDRLDQKQRKRKEKFWEDQQAVRRLSRISALMSRCHKLTDDIFSLEDKSLNLLSQVSDTGQLVEYQDQLRACDHKLERLLFDLESNLYPGSDTLVLGLYGSGTALDNTRAFYRDICQALDFEVNEYILYHLKNAMAADVFISEVDSQRENITLNTLPDTVDELAALRLNYWKSNAELPQNIASRVGVMLFVSGGCVRHFFKHEYGAVEWVAADQQKDKIRLDLSTACSARNYHIVEGCERQEFVKKAKALRTVEAQFYRDSRLPGSEVNPLPLAEHKDRMWETAIESLLDKCINLAPIKEA